MEIIERTVRSAWQLPAEARQLGDAALDGVAREAVDRLAAGPGNRASRLQLTDLANTVGLRDWMRSAAVARSLTTCTPAQMLRDLVGLALLIHGRDVTVDQVRDARRLVEAVRRESGQAPAPAERPADQLERIRGAVAGFPRAGDIQPVTDDELTHLADLVAEAMRRTPW